MLAPCIWGPLRLTYEQQLEWTKVRAELGIRNSRPEQFNTHKDLICTALEQKGLEKTT